jgi:hypothetical protein
MSAAKTPISPLRSLASVNFYQLRDMPQWSPDVSAHPVPILTEDRGKSSSLVTQQNLWSVYIWGLWLVELEASMSYTSFPAT